MNTENFNKLPLWMPSDNETIGRGESERPDRLSMKIWLTAYNIDKENEKRYWNIAYKKSFDEIVVDENGPGQSISIDVRIETQYDNIEFEAKHEDFDTACKIMYNWLEEHGYIEGYHETIKLYAKIFNKETKTI